MDEGKRRLRRGRDLERSLTLLRIFLLASALICAGAAVNGLAVLHDNNDFALAAQHLPDLAERQVRSLPGSS